MAFPELFFVFRIFFVFVLCVFFWGGGGSPFFVFAFVCLFVFCPRQVTLDREFIIMDAFPLPVEGTETRARAPGAQSVSGDVGGSNSNRSNGNPT